MPDYYAGSTIPVSLDPEDDLSSATNIKILYTKPNGPTGEWNAAASNNKVVFEIPASETIGFPGFWLLQPYYEIGGKPWKGTITQLLISKPIK